VSNLQGAVQSNNGPFLTQFLMYDAPALFSCTVAYCL
jgi:hypothetical protein